MTTVDLSKLPRHVLVGLALTGAIDVLALVLFLQTFDPMLVIVAAVLTLLLWTVVLAYHFVARGGDGGAAGRERPPPPS